MNESLKIPVPSAVDPDAYLTKKSLRDFLGGVSKSTINYWRMKRNFPTPFYLSTTLPLWKVKDIIEWVEAQKMTHEEALERARQESGKEPACITNFNS